ncbi:TPA: glycosyltransferase [Photobacterium damselae]
MKVSIVSHTDMAGGAARAAFRLHQALKDTHVQSEMIVKHKLSDDYSVISLSKYKQMYYKCILFILNKIQQLQKTKSTILHSSNLYGSSVFDLINNSDADIVNLHWINHETLSLKQVSKISKPIVMTLHDMWAFCGTEHLSIDGLKSDFRVGYKELSEDSDFVSGLNLNKIVWNRKLKYWRKPFTIVTPSDWLSKCAKESVLFKGWDIVTIPNGLNTEIFKPMDKKIARELLNLPLDKHLIGFGAMGGGKDYNKGYDLLEMSLKELSSSNNYQCIIFGQSSPKNKPNLGLPVKYIGHLSDDITLAIFYNAIDVMVVPSRQEAFGQTASEAQSCGTPVVAFNTTGLVDVIEHKTTGYLANPFDTNDLAYGIKWCINNKLDLGNNARNKAISEWSYNIISEKYNLLYEKCLNG